MRNLLLAGLVLAAATIGVVPADAASAVTTTLPGGGVTLVEGGCGPGGFRAANGFCYRRPPPREFRPRRECPYGFHLTPYGCRRNY